MERLKIKIKSVNIFIITFLMFLYYYNSSADFIDYQDYIENWKNYNEKDLRDKQTEEINKSIKYNLNKELKSLEEKLNNELFTNKIKNFISKISFNQSKLAKVDKVLIELEEKIEKYSYEQYEKLKIVKLKIDYIRKNIQKEDLKFKTLNIDKIDNPITFHIKTPENVKSLYYTSYSAGSKNKIDSLIYFAKNTEINSVIIDIKEVDWYTAFDMSDFKFDNIKPKTNNKIEDIKKLIEELHKENIYVIWRIVVFKDNLLSNNRVDLSVKNLDKKTAWWDYKWHHYLDPSSKEVWDYNANIASASYELWFDEINFDYVRFPTDWYISKTYYTFSNDLINSDSKYWKIMALNNFSSYITTKLKEKHPDIKLSADVFWLVTNGDMQTIGQKLESFLLYFDYVCPMTYPSHYAVWYLWFSVPDNHPYDILKDAMKNAIYKINNLNTEIELAKNEQRNIKLEEWFEIKGYNYEKIDKTKIRPWIQWFNCTWCKWYTAYNRTKFRYQIQAIEDSWLNSWFVWSSSSSYYLNRYNK